MPLFALIVARQVFFYCPATIPVRPIILFRPVCTIKPVVKQVVALAVAAQSFISFRVVHPAVGCISHLAAIKARNKE